MKMYSRSHLSDRELLRVAAVRSTEIRDRLADHLADIAEIDERKLYCPAGYPSMARFLELEWKLSEDVAYKHLGAARTARRFPAIFPAVADGRLNVTAALMLRTYLTEETAKELLAAAGNKTNREIEQLVAERFPRGEVPARVEVVVPPACQLAVRPVQDVVEAPCQLAARPVTLPPVKPSPWPADYQPSVRVLPPKVAPVGRELFELQLTMDKEMHDDFKAIQDLLGHQVPSGAVKEVVRRAFKAYRALLEKRKFARTDRPRQGHRSSANPRHIPAQVRRAVHRRDGGRCTFMAESGKRCAERSRLEFDHVVPVGRGGKSTVENLRLRCRAHNQYEAERLYGREFMDHKREVARRAAAAGAPS